MYWPPPTFWAPGKAAARGRTMEEGSMDRVPPLSRKTPKGDERKTLGAAGVAPGVEGGRVKEREVMFIQYLMKSERGNSR